MFAGWIAQLLVAGDQPINEPEPPVAGVAGCAGC
jgi:hypothetical protein